MWDATGESVATRRLPQFLTLQFRPWPLECVTEAMEAKARGEVAAKAKEYKKQMRQMEAMKHIDEIRRKLAWIDAFRARRQGILEKVRAEEPPRKESDEDMVQMCGSRAGVMRREVMEEVEVLELKVEVCWRVC